MDNLKRLQNLILKIIIFPVWFGLMCFTLILAGNIFHWSLLTENFENVFFTLFSISLGTLIALILALADILVVVVFQGALEYRLARHRAR